MIQNLKILGNLMSHKPVRGHRLLLPAAVVTAMAVAFATLPAAMADQTGAVETQTAVAPSATPTEPQAGAATENAPSSSAAPVSEAPATKPSATEASKEATASSASPSAPSKPVAPSPSALPTPSATFTQRIFEMQQTAAKTEAEPAVAAATKVGVPSGNPSKIQAKLIVSKGGTRTTGTNVTAVSGARFEFFRTTKDALDGGTSIDSCTTDGTGKCGLIVELPNSKNNYFYAKETTTPNEVSWGGSGNLIRYGTGAINQNGNDSDRVKSLPGANRTWPGFRANNAAPQKCGIKMAVVFDLSYSIQLSGSLAAYKEAGTSFVNSLKGTPSEIALKTFASRAPAQGSANVSVGLTSVAQPAGAEALKNKINAFTIPQDSKDYYTNWDAGLSQVESGYDVVLFLTDGEPTRYGADALGTGSSATLQGVEEAIHSANKVKATVSTAPGARPTGPKVIAVGIGMGSGTGLAADKERLKLISGPTEGSDFFTTEFSNLGQTLKTMATKDCLGTVTVVKEIQEPSGDNTPGNDWTFSSGTTSVTAGEGTSATGQTDNNGALNFKVGGFTTGSTTESRDVTFAETQQTGFELVKQGKFNAECTNVTTGLTMAITDSGTLGFTVPVKKSDVISCTVINKKLTSKISIVKTAAAYNGGQAGHRPGQRTECSLGNLGDLDLHGHEHRDNDVEQRRCQG